MVDLAQRTLVIGVPTFGPEPEPEEELDLTAWPPLPFARQLASEVAEALRSYGYDPMVVTDPEALASEELKEVRPFR